MLSVFYRLLYRKKRAKVVIPEAQPASPRLESEIDQNDDEIESSEDEPEDFEALDDDEELPVVYVGTEEDFRLRVWFGVQTQMTSQKTRDLFSIVEPISRDVPQLAAKGVKVANEVLATPGVVAVWIGSYEIIVEMSPAFAPGSIEDFPIAEIIGNQLFGEDAFRIEELEGVTTPRFLTDLPRAFNA